MRAGGFDRAFKLESLSYDIGELVEDLAEIAPGLLLEHHADTKKLTSSSAPAWRDSGGHFDWGAEFLLVVDLAKLPAEGSGDSSASISRLTEKAWPARMARPRKSRASGNCSSNIPSRLLRFEARKDRQAPEKQRHGGATEEVR